MPPKLAHKKSRLGCLRCKSRKVKCTEERPSCSACVRHGLPCEYDPNNTHAQTTTTAGKATSILSPEIPSSLEEDIDAFDFANFQGGQLELKLLHHYLTVVGRTIPITPREAPGKVFQDLRQVYTVDAVHLAFKHPFLLNTIFAVAALHRTQQQPEDRPTQEMHFHPTEVPDSSEVPAKSQLPTQSEIGEYALAHQVYLNMAIRQQREALTELDPSKAEALCYGAVLLSVIALKLLPEKLDQPYKLPLEWLEMATALATAVRVCLPYLPLDCAIHRINACSEPELRDRNANFNFEHIPPFKAVLEYPEGRYPSEEETKTYALALSYMAAIYRAIQNGDPRRQIARRLFVGGPMLPTLFVELVKQRRSRALVIFAYTMSMAKAVEDFWYFHGIAEYEVWGIKSILPEEWQWAMEWPINMINTLNGLADQEMMM